ncbi:MAG: radical SAM protein [Nanoarchaeota archaeon]|nr:radical SAM protein [Nanoarchaeota archaeon]MBU1030985.1 radical SAM protein [Nanoarchaeota archaeon]MBU1849896.1 radical SAM protein [Nanoarchaeota archaeon]
MKIQTYSVLAGSTECNAQCPYCVSKMTPKEGLEKKLSEPNWRNFDIGCNYAKESGVSTVLITGKGEPTLFPKQITKYLKRLNNYKFPFIELQTNGIELATEKYNKYLKKWYKQGMTTIALSVVHYESEKNKEIFQPKAQNFCDLSNLVQKLHNIGFSVRLTCMMVKGYIDDMDGIDKLVDFAKENKVEQLSVRSIDRPLNTRNKAVANWVDNHKIPKERIDSIREYLDKNGTCLMELVHGAIVYDYKGLGLCLTNCLTIDSKDETIRQLIFFPDGHLRYDWQHEGAILI